MLADAQPQCSMRFRLSVSRPLKAGLAAKPQQISRFKKRLQAPVPIPIF